MSSPVSSATSLVGFKRHLRVDVVEGEAVYVLSERGVTALRGTHAEALVPLLDGTRDLAGLRRALPHGVAGEEVGALLVRLMEAGLVALRPPASPGADEKALAYWEAGGLEPNEATVNTRTTTAQLIVVGRTDQPGRGIDAAAALAALTAAGLTVTTRTDSLLDATSALSVVLCDDYLSPALAAVDAAHRAAGRPWLLAKPLGTQTWIGPVFGAPDTACWQCLATRQWAHRQAEAHLQAALGRSGPAPRPPISVPPLAATALHLVALETLKWLAGYRYAGQRQVWTFDTLDLSGTHHELRPRPQCHQCGDDTLMRARAHHPVRISSRAKASRCGGGHRSLPPQQVLDRYQHLISPVTGVVKEITRDRRGPSFFNSFRAGPNVAMGARSLDGLREGLRAENGGKGVTPLHGRVSALCEALERHSGYFHGDEARIRASYASLAGQAVHPNACLLYAERQHAGASTWNPAHSGSQFVCDPFDETTELDWTPVWSLTEERHRLLPTGQLYFEAPGTVTGCQVRADSNGNAAGTSIEDAVLQGLLEIVERDAVALWWYNRTPVPALDLDAFADPWVDELREVYTGLHREVWLLDLTADLGIPTVAAMSRRTDKVCEDIMFGFGAHLDPKVAVVRALTEMNQLMPAVACVGAGADSDRDYGWTDQDAMRWWRTATIANQAYVAPDPTRPARGPADFDYRPTDDLAVDVAAIRRLIEARGMQVLVLDQTRPDIGLPVVKVIVPGMRHFWARFAPGRLYDVPVRLGRRTEPIAYDELNPIPLFV
ncbi:MAG: TOMM precursor leader peptide-binding protein [Actinophytocola sp.]|uniref:TOMM precursor leader peptide-binding protein n=1 Tax=Actinophytocola sp. TaxID=1872138 RepID=UPI001326691E|nr:TOMM precursor leader peptide-binding protein [Actinophytocola sp.]MPZ81191.1 TOMM precursor leader peptide-binding protein [Actinophytocola sp.]